MARAQGMLDPVEGLQLVLRANVATEHLICTVLAIWVLSALQHLHPGAGEQCIGGVGDASLDLT